MSTLSSAISSPLSPALAARAAGRCELCLGPDPAGGVAVGPRSGAEAEVALCADCAAALAAPGPLGNGPRWRGLTESIWSEHAAVSVLAFRALGRLPSEGWAAEALAGAYLDEDRAAWAAAEGAPEAGVAVTDCNGAPLRDGDSVTLIKDLDVKGGGFTAKRGTLVKNIRLGDDPTHVEGKVNGSAIYLKTVFLKKV